jgi:hypothetical protein
MDDLYIGFIFIGKDIVFQVASNLHNPCTTTILSKMALCTGSDEEPIVNMIDGGPIRTIGSELLVTPQHLMHQVRRLGEADKPPTPLQVQVPM